MIKQIKTILLLMFVAAGVLSFCSCGEKENGAGGESEVADYPAAMNNTRWRWKGTPDATGINCVELTFFEEDNVASLIVTTVNYTVDRYNASYTYRAGKGTLSLEHRETHATSTASFSVSGDNLTLVREGATYILPRFD